MLYNLYPVMLLSAHFKKCVMALSTAVAALIGAGIAATANTFSTVYTNQAQRRQAELAYRRQKRDIREMNAYNSPAAQIVRLRAAGINPAMSFQNGISASAGEQSAVAEYEPPQYSVPSLDSQSIVSAFTDVSRLQNESLYNEAQIQKINEEAISLHENTRRENEKHPINLDQLRQNLERGRADIQKLEAEYYKVVEDTNLAAMNIDLIAQSMKIDKVNLMMALMKLPHEVLEMDSRTALNWMNTHCADMNVRISLGYLNEAIRHNKATEGLSYLSTITTGAVGIGANVISQNRLNWDRKQYFFDTVFGALNAYISNVNGLGSTISSLL